MAGEPVLPRHSVRPLRHGCISCSKAASTAAAMHKAVAFGAVICTLCNESRAEQPQQSCW